MSSNQSQPEKQTPKQQWLLWLFIAVAIPLVYLAVRSGGDSETRTTLPLELSSVPTVSRENSEHELAALATELEKNPDHTPVLLRMAQLSRDLGRPADAIGHLRAAIEVDPDNAEARLELGRMLYQSGDLAGSIEETTLLLEQDPENVDALYNLGAIYGNMMDDARARVFWERVIAIDPDSESGRLAARGLASLSAATVSPHPSSE